MSASRRAFRYRDRQVMAEGCPTLNSSPGLLASSSQMPSPADFASTFADLFRRRLRGLQTHFASQLSVLAQGPSLFRRLPFAEPAALVGTSSLFSRCYDWRPASARHALIFLNPSPALAQAGALAFPLPQLSARYVPGAGRGQLYLFIYRRSLMCVSALRIVLGVYEQQDVGKRIRRLADRSRREFGAFD
jgi:hypothetical protein